MPQDNRIWQSMKKAYYRYDRMMEKQGFYIVLGVCVLIIALSAMYTFHFRDQWAMEQPDDFPGEYLEAVAEETQTLAQAQSLVQSSTFQQVVSTTEAPLRFMEPAEGRVIRDFSMTEPQLFEQARYWRVHPGIDIEADYGAVVKACASGRVISVGEEAEKGLCIRILHQRDFETVYAGLSDAGYIQAGDFVAAGQTIGHVGNGVAAETDASAHLHFEVWKKQSAIDPVKLFLGVME